MGFITKAMGGGSAAKMAGMQAQMAELKTSQAAQAKTLADEAANVKSAEDAQRRIRGGGKRGLLAYSENTAGLSTTLGGAG